MRRALKLMACLKKESEARQSNLTTEMKNYTPGRSISDYSLKEKVSAKTFEFFRRHKSAVLLICS